MPLLPDGDPFVAAEATISNLSVIRQLPFFLGATDEILHRFMRRTRWRTCAANEVIIDAGDRTDEVFFITEGAVRVVVRTASGYESILNDLNAGEFFGEMAAIDGIKRSANVTALFRTRLCIVSATDFMELVLSTPEVGRRLLHLLSTRLRAKDDRLLELGALSVRHRLIADLLRLSRDRGGGERVISPPPPQHILAARIGARRESVSRELVELSRAGLLTIGRQAIVLHQPEIMRMEVLARVQGTGRRAIEG